MGYVYRYIDCNDGIIKYVGIVWSDNRKLSRRIKEHQNDYWYDKGDWKIEYLEKDISSRTDAEYIESHLISLYHTDKWYNLSKAAWGVSSYIDIDESQWKDYNFKPINDQLCSITIMLSTNEYDKLLSISKESNQSCNLTIRRLIRNSQINHYELNNSECYEIYISFDDMLKYYRAHPNTTTTFISKLSINAGICKNPQMFTYTFSLDENIMSCTWKQQVYGETKQGIYKFEISNNKKDIDMGIYAVAIPCRQVCTNDKNVVSYLIGEYSIELSKEKKRLNNIQISDLFLKEKEYESHYTILGLDNIDAYFHCNEDNNTTTIFMNDGEMTLETDEFLRKYGMYDCVDRNSRMDYINQLENTIHRLSECL